MRILRLAHAFRLAAALCALALFALPRAAGAATAPTGLAPDFTLHAADGRNVRLDELRGQVVLVNFWATWCGPCRSEMPHLDQLYQKYHKSGFVLLGVNIDDNPATALSTCGCIGWRFA